MKNYLDKMKDEILLTNDDIEGFRKNIMDKYPAISKKGQASLLAKEMNKVLDEQMNGVPVSYRSDIRKEIYTSFISAISSQLTKLDVFKGVETVLKEDLNYLDVLYDWMQNNTTYEVEYRTFKSFMVVNYEHFIETGELMDLEPILPEINTAAKVHFQPMEKTLPKRLLLFIPVFIAVALILNLFFNVKEPESHVESSVSLPAIEPFMIVDLTEYIQESYNNKYVKYPDNVVYRKMDVEKVKAYLAMKNSALLEADYLETLEDVCYEFNVSPYLMLAIIGQEQNFIKADLPHKMDILKNPFNVYNSWQDYGISFRDSAEIAARTVRNRLDTRPLGEDPIEWINETYAQDPEWYLGVRYFFNFFNENM